MKHELKRILCVDDEPDILEVAGFALENLGNLEVHKLYSGKEALEKIESIKPDLILLDVMMPNMDGMATLKAMRNTPKLSNIPVIFMTAKVQPSEVPYYLTLGAIGVIPKPFDPMTISEEIKKLWESSYEK